jgi:type IV secretory pathway VirB10-like protein
MANESLLSSDGSPESIHPVGVRRLNHIPLYIVGAILVVFALLVWWVAVEKGQKRETKTEDHGGSATDFASQVVGDRVGYVQADHVAIPTPAPTPVAVIQAAPDTNELAARQKAFYEALFAKSSVADPGLAQVNTQEHQETVSPDEAARAIPEGTPSDIGVAAAPPSFRDPNSLATYNGAADRWKLNTHLEPPSTPYILRTGFVIPALLISAMESELPGTIIAQVSEDVYDTPTGKYLLIPQGSRLIGEYSNAIQYGQARIFVAWERIIYPNGSALDIGAMPGADGQGEAGFRDQVDNHFLRLFGSALLMSAITGGITYSQTQGQGYNNGYESPNAANVLSAAVGQQLGAATSALLERNLSIPPTLKIRQGFRFNIVVTKDLTFARPYVVPDY